MPEPEVKPVETPETLTAEELAIDAQADRMLKTEQAENNAEARLEKVFGDEPTPEETPKAEATPTPEPAAEVPTPAPVETPAEKPADVPADAPAPVETPADESTKITDAEIRAAKHYEYSDEDIKKLTDADPVLAKKTFAKMLRDENSLSKKFSEAGKKLVAAPTAPPVPVVKPELKKVDIEALRKEYEGDPIVDVLAAVQANAETLAAQLAARPVAESFTESEATRQVQAARQQEDAAISQQIDGFFLRPDVKALKNFYGDVSVDSEGQPIPKENRNWDNLTQGQLKNRWKVMQEANLIKMGMEAQGLKPDLEEVFDRAHLLTTADVRETVIRTKIKAEATKRQAGLTLAPSSSKAVPVAGVRTLAKAEENAGKNLAKVFS